MLGVEMFGVVVNIFSLGVYLLILVVVEGLWDGGNDVEVLVFCCDWIIVMVVEVL